MHILKKVKRYLIRFVGLFFVGLILTEPFTIHPNVPASYIHALGGPSYGGAVLVRTIPGYICGIIFIVLAARKWQQKRRDKADATDTRN